MIWVIAVLLALAIGLFVALSGEMAEHREAAYRSSRVAAESAAKDEVIVRQEAHVATLERTLAYEQGRVDALTERLVTMKQQGFQATAKPQEAAQLAPLPAVVRQALDAVQDPDAEELARAWLALGAEEKQVARRIIEGGKVPA